MSDILGRLAGQFLSGSGDNPLSGMLQQVLGGGSQGGLAGLLSQLDQAGLGEQARSWIGTGPSLPVSPDQIAQAFGGGQLAELAQRFGVPPEMVSTALAQFLPGAVDRMTPQGHIQDAGPDGLAGILGQLFGGR